MSERADILVEALGNILDPPSTMYGIAAGCFDPSEPSFETFDIIMPLSQLRVTFTRNSQATGRLEDLFLACDSSEMIPILIVSRASDLKRATQEGVSQIQKALLQQRGNLNRFR